MHNDQAPEPTEGPELIGSKEAARLSNVSRATFNRWVADGRITPVHSLNGRTGARLFDADQVKAMTGAAS